ncbi:MAG TPA: hypothetical protein PK012_30965 [Blastocatellia bacterium]|nr:hypothetical protein [Blastocatellia bacterium]
MSLLLQLGYGQTKVKSNSLARTKTTSSKNSSSPPRPTSPSTIVFVGADAGTRGDWSGRYGTEGYNVVGDVKSYPAYAQVTRNGLATWTWEQQAEDARALRKISAAGRIASACYEDDTLSFAVNITDGKRHQLSLYFVDWDYRGRVQQVDIVNAGDNTVLDSRTVSNFGGGQYLTWNISGTVIIRLTKMAGLNAVCSGLFFDSAATPARAVPPVRTPTPTPTPTPIVPTNNSATEPELPRVLLDTTFPTVSGKTITVSEGSDLQAALNAAQPGDTVVLQAGVTFTAPSGGFVLPAKTNSNGQWIIVRSSNLSALAADACVTPAQASAMPKVVSKDVAPALVTAPGAAFWRLAGLEVTVAETALANATIQGVAPNYGLMRLGDDLETNANNLAADVVIDRCYIHGRPTKNVRRGVALNSRRTAIIDSYFADFHETGSDSQAIAGWNGPGPFKIVNNHLEGAGENVLFGGSDPAVTNLVPSDIEFRRNHLIKPRSWMPGDPSFAGIAWSVKNILELKNARRVLVDGNVLENNWVSGQNGFAILFTVRNQDGAAPWSTVEDVTFTNNLVRHAASAINILGRDYSHPSGQAKRLKIKNNVFDDISDTPWGGAGRFLQITDTIDVKVENNTVFHTGNLLMGYTNLNTPSNTGFIYRNNIAANNSYGVIGDGTAPGLDTLNTYFPGAAFAGNILAGAQAGIYPAGNYFPPTLDSVGFTNRWNGNYSLTSDSPFKNSGTDGKDPGVDAATLNAALADVAP